MKTVILQIEETHKYKREMAISIPDDMTNEQLDQLITSIEKNSECDSAKDIEWLLNKSQSGIKIDIPPDGDMDNPTDSEVEVEQIKFITENQN